METRLCSLCKEYKPLSMFQFQKIKGEYRRRYHCTPCKRITSRGNRTAQSERYRNKYPKKTIACRRLNYYKAKSKIIKPKECIQCGVKTLKLEAHHRNYDEPLTVKWLCQKCHNKLHRVGR